MHQGDFVISYKSTSHVLWWWEKIRTRLRLLWNTTLLWTSYLARFCLDSVIPQSCCAGWSEVMDQKIRVANLLVSDWIKFHQVKFFQSVSKPHFWNTVANMQIFSSARRKKQEKPETLMLMWHLLLMRDGQSEGNRLKWLVFKRQCVNHEAPPRPSVRPRITLRRWKWA